MENVTVHKATRELVRFILSAVQKEIFQSEKRYSCHLILCTFPNGEHTERYQVIGSNLNLMKEVNSSEDESITKKLADYISLYIYPIFILLGILGNSLSCFLMLSNARRGSAYPASLYLTFLAFADFLYLIVSAVPDWISRVDEKLDIKTYSNLSCRFAYWFGNIVTHLSAGLVVALTVERFIAVQYPLIAHKISTVTRTRCALIGLLLFYLILDSPVLVLVEHFTEQIHEVRVCRNDNTSAKYQRYDFPRCGLAKRNHNKTWAYVDLAVYTLIPFLIIGTLNSLIIRRLLDAQRFRKHMFRFQNHRLLSNGSFEAKCRQFSESRPGIELTDKTYRNLQRFQSLPDTKPLASILRPKPSQIDERRRKFSVKQSSISTEYSTLSLETKSRSQYQCDSSFVRHRKSIISFRKNNTRLTILLLSVSGSFLILTLPTVLFNLIQSKKSKSPSLTIYTNQFYSSISSDPSYSQTILFYTLVRLLMIINHSINFILYLLLGKRFRRDFKELFFNYWLRFSKEQRRTRRQSNSYQRNSK